MQKSFSFLLIFVVVAVFSCSGPADKKQIAETPADSTMMFPVTDFLEGQLIEIEKMPVTPLKTITIGGKVDSDWVTREDIRAFAAPFLSPKIDSISMSQYFAGKSFLDATLNLVTLTYDPKVVLPKTMNLRHWDVYINPENNGVQRVYLVYESQENDVNITKQLTWTVGKWCSIRTISQKENSDPEIKEERIIWKF
ncbi:MAG: hypothetical protein ABIO77_05465 [Ginsengibacter sp.]